MATRHWGELITHSPNAAAAGTIASWVQLERTTKTFAVIVDNFLDTDFSGEGMAVAYTRGEGVNDILDTCVAHVSNTSRTVFRGIYLDILAVHFGACVPERLAARLKMETVP